MYYVLEAFKLCGWLIIWLSQRQRVVDNVVTTIKQSKGEFAQQKQNAQVMPVAYQVYYGKIELSQSLLSEQKFSSNIFSVLKYSYGPLMSTHAKEIAQ